MRPPFPSHQSKEGVQTQHTAENTEYKSTQTQAQAGQLSVLGIWVTANLSTSTYVRNTEA